MQYSRWVPFKVLLNREIRRFVKVLAQTVLTPFISSSLYLLIFGLSLKIDLNNGVSYLAFLIPGLVMMGCLNQAFQNTSSSVVASRFSGEIADYKVSVLSNEQIIWAMSLGSLTRGLLVSSSVFVVGELFHFHQFSEFLPIAHPFVLVFFLIVGGLSFAQLGIAVAFWAKTFDQMSALNSFVLVPLIYLGGVFFSLKSLPPFWQEISKFNPLLYFINGVRYGILGQSDVSIILAMSISIFSLGLFYVLTLFCLKRSTFGGW